MCIFVIPNLIIMKNNAFIAVVIFLITIAFLFVVNDLSKTPNSPTQASVHKIH